MKRQSAGKYVTRCDSIRGVDYAALEHNCDIIRIQECLTTGGDFTDRLDAACGVLTEAIASAAIESNTRKPKQWFDSECYVMKKAVKKSYTEWRVNSDAASHDCHADNVTSFQRLKRQRKSQYADNTINAQISKEESLVRDFWKVWKTFSSNVSVTLVAANVWFEHFSHLFYNERAPLSLPELDKREVSGLTDEISIYEVIAATSHCEYAKAASLDGIATDGVKNCSTILVWPLYYIFNFCFSSGACPSVWLSSYLLPLYKGKGPLSEPDSYRGVALQCVVLKLYTYILNHRIGDWPETEGVIPDQQNGFPNNRSTTTAIKLLNQYVSEALATPKTPISLCHIMWDFIKAFDSVDRSPMLCKLTYVGPPGKVIKAIWPIVREKFVQITTAECLSNSVTQNVGLAQGECLLLYSIFALDLLAIIEGQ